MYLKCLGGPFDQEKRTIPSDRCKQGEYWAIEGQPKMLARDFDPNKMPKVVTTERHVYIVETVRCKETKFMFLRYDKIPIEELFTKIFT